MKENYLKIIFVIDESGSMQGTESDVVGGFNQFVAQQKKAEFGKITVSLYKFNSQWSRVVNDLPIDEIRPLTSEDYTPGGLTALYDTIGNAIRDMQNRTHFTEPEHQASMVMMVVITDGQENASTEYDSGKVKEMIRELEQTQKWQFIYLGADLDSFADADTLGFSHKASSRKSDLKRNFDVVSEHAARFRIAEPDEDIEILMKGFVDDLGKGLE
jgi:uncharacterized protein YegL